MIVCVGLATRDTIYRLPELPEPDGRVVADERVVAGGGPAATAAVAIARLGVPVRFVGVVDEELPGVETHALPGRMVESTILVGPDGTRAIVTEQPQRFTCPPELLQDADWVHVDHVGYHALPASNSLLLSVDAGFPLPDVDTATVDLWSPPEPMDDGRRGKLTVVTRGADGCTAYTEDGGRIDVPGERVEGVVSTLGAGDVFHGALLAAFAHGLELREALAAANRAAALSCRALDGRSAVPTWDEVAAG
ncbi:MAG TPA: PfkB family carbohydrate kinase [Gaiellaceae bacterium]|nr:PfkB family carbohydrate kinase [Gaiellaceae bacterium]